MADRYYVNANLLNLREAASRAAAIVTVLPRGRVLEEVATSPVAGWVNVVTTAPAEPLAGFVSADFVFKVGEPAAVGADARVSPDRLKRFAPVGKPDVLAAIARGFQGEAATYGIDANRSRLCHFLAQASHECMGFTRMHELGGPSYWRRYEGVKRLGNVQPGDGVRFHGRGIFQLTGRANYTAIGDTLGLALVANPDLAADPAVAFTIACRFWDSRHLNANADADDIVEITRRINGGQNGLDDRRLLLGRARTIWG